VYLGELKGLFLTGGLAAGGMYWWKKWR